MPAVCNVFKDLVKTPCKALPFEEAAILTIDGMGDFTSTMRGLGRGNQIGVLDSVSYPHSIGIFYTTFTQYLGFPHYGDEYKFMGLSPYSIPRYLDKLRDVVRFRPNGLRNTATFFKSKGYKSCH